jgi:hypothetical protein
MLIPRSSDAHPVPVTVLTLERGQKSRFDLGRKPISEVTTRSNDYKVFI